MPDLPLNLESNEEVEAWENYLNSIPKEELVALLLDRMIADAKMFDFVRMRFLHEEQHSDLQEILKAFDHEIDIAYKAKVIDDEFVIATTRYILRVIDMIPASAQKKEAYDHIIERLQDGVENHGLGWPDDSAVREFISELEKMK